MPSNTEKFHKAYANYWLREYGTDPDPVRRHIVFPAMRERYSKSLSGKDVLDLGCGNSSVLEELDGWNIRSYTGVDRNPFFIQRTAHSHLSESVRFVVADFDQRGWADTIRNFRPTEGEIHSSSYNLIISLFVFNELIHPLRFLNGARSLLSSRGSVFLALNHPFVGLLDLHRSKEQISNYRRFPGMESYFSDSQVDYRFTRGDFEVPSVLYPMQRIFALISRAGLKVEWMDELGAGPEVVAQIPSYAGTEHIPRFLLLGLKKDISRHPSSARR